MILFIIGSVLAAAGIITLTIGSKKIKNNILIERENEKLKLKNNQLKEDALNLEHQREKEFYKLEQINQRLEDQKKALKEQIEENKNQLQSSAENYFDILEITYQAKELEFELKTKQLKDQMQYEIEKEKEECYSAFEKYVSGLDKYYQKVDRDFDNALDNIKLTLKDYQDELEKIKQTYAAAREAQIRDEQIQNKMDFYKLHLSSVEQSTITLIEELKPRLPDPRVLCMLIWSTFYQKQMNALCANVLGPNAVCGIYKITNQKNGLCYIGQSVDCAKRFKDHVKCGLGIDTPAQNKLYKAMQKDGVTNFTFELLEECEKELLNEKERFYIDLYQSCDYGYNSNRGVN